MSVTLEKREGWYWLSEMAVGGKVAPGYVRPTSITLKAGSPLESRRMEVTYLYHLSNDPKPPFNESVAKKFIADDKDNRFVAMIPNSVRSINEVEGFLTTQIKNLFAKDSLGLAPTVKLFEAMNAGKTRMRGVYPIEHPRSPTGYLTVWDVAHTEDYALSETGRLEVLSSGTTFRCGWGVMDMIPEAYYSYPDDLTFYHAHEFKSWPSILQDLHRVSILDGFVYKAEPYRRTFR